MIRYLVREMSFPIEIVPADTRREDDGLAMSSRNQYLSEDERARAVAIHRVLGRMRDGAVAGRSVADIEADAAAELGGEGFDVDYAVLRRRDFQAAEAGDREQVALVAARIGRTLLIDNLEFERPPSA